jgi:hypothetical protein
MEEERAVHPIVPNKSLDDEGFTFAGEKCDVPQIAAKARWHGRAATGRLDLGVHAQYVMTAACDDGCKASRRSLSHFPLTQSLLGPQAHPHYMIGTSGTPGIPTTSPV